jgi:uncharacterized membrane protein YkvA (DUF1232 family)
MSENPQHPIASKAPGVFGMVTNEIKLMIRLMMDERVNLIAKLIPVAALAYIIWPIDLLIGPIDDAAVAAVAGWLFVELCPPEVVAEHRAALNGVAADPNTDPLHANKDEEVIDAEYWERKDK